MNDDDFWKIVERSRRGAAGDVDAQGLTALPVEDIIAWDRIFQERVRARVRLLRGL